MSSVARFRGAADPLAVGRELGVGGVLTGSVRSLGDTLSVSAALVDAADGRQLWGETFERTGGRIPALQSEIAGEIVRALRLRLSGEAYRRLAKAPTGDREAYLLWLQGRYRLAKRTDAEIRKALELFRQALDRDPTYAQAWAGTAAAWDVLAYTGLRDPDEAFPRAREAARKALDLDPSNTDALAVLAHVTLLYEKNASASEKIFRKALAIDPNAADARHWYAHFLSQTDRRDESAREGKKLLELEPLSLVANLHMAEELDAEGRLDDAAAQLRKTIDLDPTFLPRMDDPREARDEARPSKGSPRRAPRGRPARTLFPEAEKGARRSRGRCLTIAPMRFPHLCRLLLLRFAAVLAAAFATAAAASPGPDVAAYMKIGSARSPSFSPDGKEIVYVVGRLGAPPALDRPGRRGSAPPAHGPRRPCRLRGVVARRDVDRLFRRARRRDESAGLADPTGRDGGETHHGRRNRDELARDVPGRRKALAIASNRKYRAHIDAWVYDVASGVLTMGPESKGSGGIRGPLEGREARAPPEDPATRRQRSLPRRPRDEEGDAPDAPRGPRQLLRPLRAGREERLRLDECGTRDDRFRPDRRLEGGARPGRDPRRRATMRSSPTSRSTMPERRRRSSGMSPGGTSWRSTISRSGA